MSVANATQAAISAEYFDIEFAGEFIGVAFDDPDSEKYGRLALELFHVAQVVSRVTYEIGAGGDSKGDEFRLGAVNQLLLSLSSAMKKAAGKAVPGDVVLLSPGCASFDEFRNFEHRGERFRAIAQEGP